ncbi:daunorubicin resistance protein DrrA family ABC transporter ATP-binding protein [Methanosphaerula palustris]|uniref:Daunorubicin resistance ABC transporter ATPase subunit n=1 Tax=Methanosphaerula palustris (strain ATCC BAA-1556 / DSM 19958 / E1-9c) TaxID=521011 RepID=B8GH65_METPE|nr:daunorubicin resistance protein DrrA family ABC transporter ATP-binding protein [Methanosphaerula palustris]ACL16470.1 daunorubicin resistance ABC transporter ATPase subunit [Methanosphaerula palustris E1-9c]
MYAVETENLTKKFGDLTAVDGLNIRIQKGQIFGLLGPNGAGKSTLLPMLCTVASPTSGSARVNGYDIIRESEMVRQSIGIVFQSISVDDRLTGRENLRFHAMLYDVPNETIEDRIDEVLQLLELEDRADSLVRTYSGGMIRRLEMARGLLHHPEVLFLDEPTVGLDPQTREHIWDYIQNLTRTKRENLTIVMTTHYMEEADQLCDDIAIIDHGVIKVRDSPEKLKNLLEEDVVTVRTAQPEALAHGLAGQAYVLGITTGDSSLQISVRNGQENAPKIVNLARDLGIEVDSIVIEEPSLNDVFLYHTSKEIREEDGDNFLKKYKRKARDEKRRGR